MAGKAMLVQDRTNIAVELQLLLSLRGRRDSNGNDEPGKKKKSVFHGNARKRDSETKSIVRQAGIADFGWEPFCILTKGEMPAKSPPRPPAAAWNLRILVYFSWFWPLDLLLCDSGKSRELRFPT
jgi:hypothetical protein